jgi:hypothetical protein
MIKNIVAVIVFILFVEQSSIIAFDTSDSNFEIFVVDKGNMIPATSGSVSLFDEKRLNN